MARIKIEMPGHFPFTTHLQVRITDLNYGGHAGNDTILSLIHEARMQFLVHHGYKELELAGVGLIMSDAAIEFKSELFYAETVNIGVAAGDFSRLGFDLYYLLEKEKDGKTIDVAYAKTGMVCFDYANKKVAALPDEVRERLS
jgi:acyl-CoA thioester hydrolase